MGLVGGYPGDMEGRDDSAALVALLRHRPRGVSYPDVAASLLATGSALVTLDRVLSGHDDDADQSELFVQESRTPEIDEAIAEASHDLACWEAEGMRFLAAHHPQFPARVRSIREVPPFLMARGALAPDDRTVSVVGSRKASGRGRSMADAVARHLVSVGYGVLSGLADGIDATAHRAALESGGRTVALIGTGLRQHYPAKNRALQDEIAAKGLLLSQFWPDAPPQRHNFLMRNAIMSGYGHATVVVEAGEHSGARAQARMAVEHGRPVILTDQVVESNEWARALVGRPRVFVAAGLSDVDVALGTIARSEASATELARQLVPDLV